MEEKMTWNLAWPKMNHVSWSSQKSNETIARGYPAKFLG
jgi:hypothetical protein